MSNNLFVFLVVPNCPYFDILGSKLVNFRFFGCWGVKEGDKSVVKRGNSSGDMQRIFLTFREAQQFLNISHQTLYKLMKEGLPSHKIARNRVFFKEDLIQWIREH